jgi:ribosomal protein L35AE/L33A
MRTALLLVTGTAVLAAACGGSMPAGPSASPPRASGAVVQGTVAGVSGASQDAVRATSATALRVSVIGTSLTTTTDGAGRFVLSGVPTGTVTLRFEGEGVDARLEISGLAGGQVITIVVRVSGHEASLLDASPLAPSPAASPTPRPSPSPEDDDEGTEVEFKGTVQSVNPPDLRVAGRTVHTNGNTKIVRKDQRIGLSDVKVGATVEVEGARQADGSVLAKKIKVEDGEEGEEEDE